MDKIFKPKRLFFIGWGWLLFASFSLFETLSKVPKLSEKKELLQSLLSNPPQQFADTVELIRPIAQNFYLLMVLKAFLGLLGIIAAINFLRLKNWAKTLLEILSWTMVLLVLAVMLFAIIFNASVTAGGHSLKWGISYALIVLTLCTLPFVLSGCQLRSKVIRGMFNT